MDNLDLVLEASEGRHVGVGSRGVNVVPEWQDSIDRFCRPVGEEVIEEALIAAVEAALILGEFDQIVEGIDRRLEDENAGVEAAWPAAISNCGDFITLEEIVDVLDDKSIRVEEHHFAVLNQFPAVKLEEKFGERKM